MSNNNPTGINGYGIKNYPPKAVLREHLHQYAKEGLTVKQRLERLKTDLDLKIGKSKLAELNSEHKVPSTRKPIPREIAVQAILDIVSKDANQSKGIKAIKGDLAEQELQISQNLIREIVAKHAPEGLSKRFPGAQGIPRTPLIAIGPNHQHHADSHEKLSDKALKMGDVGLDIYGIKDQWSSFILHLVTVPNCRLETTAGHIFLDCVEKHQCTSSFLNLYCFTAQTPNSLVVPITLVTDKGSETGIMYAFQRGIRESYAPNIDPSIFPAFLHLKSVHNTPIESLWSFMRKHSGINFKEEVQKGMTNGAFDASSQLHKDLFRWLWPKILQIHLDKYTEYWNNHDIRYQREKVNMSGTTPRHAFTCPPLPAEDCCIPVDLCVVEALHKQIPIPQEEAMRWVSNDFDVLAQAAYDGIGAPSLAESTLGWTIFSEMEKWISNHSIW